MKSQTKWFALTFLAIVCSLPPAYAVSDPCSLLTQAQVSTTLGTNVNPAKGVAPRLCEWSAPNQPNSMNGKKVTVLLKDERTFQSAKSPIMLEIKTITASGICDDAVYTVTPGVGPGLGTALYVKKGSSYFAVRVYGFPDQTKVMGLEKSFALSACSKL